MEENINKHELLDSIVADYTRRTREGRAPDIAEYKREHPTIAADIEDVLSSVAMIEGLKAESKDPQGTANSKQISDLSGRKQLGDYVLIREIGRGGMGVVFEAVHQSLGRRVALKVMLEHEFESEKQITRFRREAQAAAKLHHTNIVSVFGVGEADGYHFYVMEYIDGVSLKSAIHSLTDKAEKSQSTSDNNRLLLSSEVDTSDDIDETKEFFYPPTCTQAEIHGGQSRYKWVGKIGAQVADALGYSHQMGILHRDIKPANLMLDDNGQVWITDFGLVKISDEEQITKTGAVLGTPQYLAPESLKGQYDQQSETYCLGLSLYELATLKPAFASGSPAEVFHRVIHETPAGPVKIDPSIPKDLATIIETAINKDPKQRYENAFALRDDLRAFIDDRPISARRPSSLEQATRWARKNPVVASLATLSALLVCATAIVASSAWAVTNQAYGELKVESKKTQAALQSAEENEQLALMNELLAENNEKDALQNYERAEANVKLMVETFDELFVEFLQKDSQGAAGNFDFNGFNELAGIEISVDAADAGYLKKMADFYERFARQNADNENLLGNAAKGWRRVANINFLIGDDEAAVASYEKAVSCCKEILQQNPESDESLINLVATRSELSNAVRRNSKYGERFTKPLSLIKENLDAIDKHAHQDDPQIRFAKAETLTALASAEVCRLAADNVIDFDRPNDERRRSKFKQAPKIYDKQAKQNVAEAVKIADELIKSDPDNIEYRLLLGRSHCSLGALELNFGETQVAVDSLNKAAALFQALSKQYPQNSVYSYQAAVTLMLMPTEDGAITEVQVREVQKTADELKKKSSTNAEYTQLQIVSRLKLADLELSNNRPLDAMAELQDAAEQVKVSGLKGPAMSSMLRALWKTAMQISRSLPRNEGQAFTASVRSKLRKEFDMHMRRGRRRGPGR